MDATSNTSKGLARGVRSIAIALAAFAALALAPMTSPTAAAQTIAVPAPAPMLATAQQLALTRWGRQACHGLVAIRWEHLGTRTNAQSRWMSIDAADPSTYTGCTIAFSLDVRWDWPRFCTIVEHELGHLSGHEHSPNPADVMSAYYYGPVSECTLPGAAVAAAAPVAAPVKQVTAKRTSTARKAAKAKAAKAKRARAVRGKANRADADSLAALPAALTLSLPAPPASSAL